MSEAIYMWDGGGLNVLIPKRRGTGYLKCPLGHHVVLALSDIEQKFGCDLCGLDGYLQVDYFHRPHGRAKSKEDAVAQIMPLLAKHFKFDTWREDTKAFWDIVIPLNDARRRTLDNTIQQMRD